MGSVATKLGRSPALLKFDFDSLSSVVPSLREALQPFTAVVLTGGSSGIGKSFIRLLGRLKPELVICNLSRRSPVENISTNPGKLLNHFPCDLTQSAELVRTVDGLRSWLEREVPRGRILLINNSGFGTFGPFPKLNLEHELEMIDLNVRAVVHLTGLLLPTLQERGGVIINISSTVAFLPTAFAATYGATKAFVLHWTLALNEELRGSTVRAIAVCPGTTATNFFHSAGTASDPTDSALTMTPDAVAAAALNALAGRSSQVVPGFGNKVYTFLSSKIPKTLATRIAGKIFARRWRNQAAK